MNAAKAWCAVGLLAAAALSSVSCGKDEVSDGEGEILGGAGGTGGTSSSRAGSMNAGGEGMQPGGASNTRLGRGCIEDADCEDDDAPGMICLKPTDTSEGAAPPGGLCTIPCATEAECAEVSAGAVCYPVVGGNNGYCVEGCSFGETFGQTKCHNREDFACNPALLADTGDPCQNDNGCTAGELCLENPDANPGDTTCHAIIAACLPSCQGDLDCADGLFCDRSFLNGFCVEEEQTGKGLAEACTVTDNEPDECLGFCQPSEQGSEEGACSQNCPLESPCSYDSESKLYEGICLYASAIAPEGSTGDFGFCTPACNCPEECGSAALTCVLPGGELDDSLFTGRGLCVGVEATQGAEILDDCQGAGGTGGAGGAPSGSGGDGSAGDAAMGGGGSGG